MMFLLFTFVWLNMHWTACGFGSLPILEPPKGKVKVLSLEICETTDSTDTSIVFDGNLDIIRADDRALSFTATVPFELNDDITFSLVIDKWTDDEWFLNFYSLDGSVCVMLQKYMPKMWSKFAKAVIPNLGDDCPHPPGDYSIKDFELNKEDVTFPSLLYGLFRINFKVYDGDGINILCQILTTDVTL